MLRITAKEQLTPNMLRITLQGEQLHNMDWKPGCYVKLKIPQGDSTKMRTYTARSYDPTTQSVAIDFAIHRPAGPATGWALEAQVGDEIELMGPGHLKTDISQGDWYLLGADMAALPATISVLEALPEDAVGYAFLEVTDESDRQEFKSPAGIQVQWFIHPNPKQKSDRQLNAIQGLELLEGTPNIFIAGELSTVREIRNYVKEKPEFQHAESYVSSYWKIGSNEEEHKQAKRQGMTR